MDGFIADNFSFNIYPPDTDSVIGCIESVSFDENGTEYTSESHGVTVKIPPNVISKGRTGKMVLTASLMAPVEVPTEFKPVSAMIWLCMNVKLQGCISVSIPHCVNVETKSHSERLCFLKTEDHCSVNHQTKKTMKFLRNGNFPVGERCGETKIDHFCYYCIAIVGMKETDVNIDLSSSFQMVAMMQIQPDILTNLWEVHVCILHTLPSCLKVSSL